MTVAELIAKLQVLPQDAEVHDIDGTPVGVVTHAEAGRLCLNFDDTITTNHADWVLLSVTSLNLDRTFHI